MEIKELSKRINDNAKAKGFWDKDYNVAEKLMLIVSELSEAMEADRINQFCGKYHYRCINAWDYDTEKEQWLETFSSMIKNTFEDELADAVIRIFDLAYQRGIDLTKHIKMKMQYNESRPYKHNKKY